MSRSKPKRWSVRFELAPENYDHVRLHDHLDKLAETDASSDWIRRTLVAALPAMPKARDNGDVVLTRGKGTPSVNNGSGGGYTGHVAAMVRSELTPESFEDNDVHYVPPEEIA